MDAGTLKPYVIVEHLILKPRALTVAQPIKTFTKFWNLTCRDLLPIKPQDHSLMLRAGGDPTKLLLGCAQGSWKASKSYSTPNWDNNDFVHGGPV